MRLLILSMFFITTSFAKGLFVHTFVHCGSIVKTKKILMYNAFTNPSLCDAGMMAYPASETECKDSDELIDKCKRPIECKAKFTCTVITENTNSRRLIKQVKDGENIILYQKVDPFATLTESQEQLKMTGDNESEQKAPTSDEEYEGVLK